LSEGLLVQGSDILPDHLVRLAGSIERPVTQGAETALDDPYLIDTTADVAELAQDETGADNDADADAEVEAQDLDGFSADDDRFEIRARPLPGHRAIQ
jgi:hypothetical protein